MTSSKSDGTRKAPEAKLPNADASGLPDREEMADDRDRAADERDEIADVRDKVADDRDRVADDRDELAGGRPRNATRMIEH